MDSIFYLGMAAGVLILLIIQTICFIVYITKVKSKQSRYNNLARQASSDGNYEGRYKNPPRKQDPPKPVDESNELYEYIKPVVEAKPPPPPIATLPKTPRPQLPLPQSNADKASTFTAPSAQLFLEQFGRQVSTMPLPACRPAVTHLIPNISAQSYSPKLVRPTSSTSPPPLRRESPMAEKPMIYESLPDIRKLANKRSQSSLNRKPAMPLPSETLRNDNRSPLSVKHKPLVQLPNETSWNDNRSPSSVKHKPLVPLPNETSWNATGTAQSNFGIRKPPAPLPTETSRNLLQVQLAVKPNVRVGQISPRSYHTQASPSNLTNNAPKVANELMEKLRKRAELISPDTTMTPKKQRTQPWARENPLKERVEEDSSDEEWTMEELKTINMYNI